MKASTSSIFKRTWEKFLLTAYAIVIENPANGSIMLFRNTDQQAGLKFAVTTGTNPIAGCS